MIETGTRRNEQARDVRRAITLMFWAAFAGALLLGSSAWSPINGLLAKLKPRVAEAPPGNDRGEVYTGAIIFVPPVGDDCWQRMLDNRTGRMWDKGRIECDPNVRNFYEKGPERSMSGERMLAIGKALRNSGGGN